MYLKYVDIQGFKSFPDRTRIKFDRVLTGIVGPNGSGKSNISDAVKWVLGETSSKSLRGGKMEDVIFGGTLTTRRPMGFAQVSLCLDNEDGRIPDAGNEVLVTRRYYRSGDSEYSVNGASVRLRDIREMFMDTGLGRDGYSIIGQGRISEVVDSRPMDRREVFEEASGIALYRFRKNEAQRKLDSAQDNLERLRDIAGELEERIGPLKEQSEKAKRFIELAGERKGLEITLYSDTIRRSRENLKAQQEKLEIAKLDYAAMEDKLRELDSEVEKLYEDSRYEEAMVSEYTGAITDRSSRIAELESSIAVIKNDIMHGERELRGLQDELDSLSADDLDLRQDIEKRELESGSKKAEAAALQDNIAQLEQDLEKLIESSAETDKRRSDTAARLNEIGMQIGDIRTGIAAAGSTLEALDEREQAVKEARDSQQARADAQARELEDTERYCRKLEKDRTSRENEAAGYRMKLESRTARAEELGARLARADQDVNALRQRISVLNDMESSMEGYMPPVRKVISAGRDRELRGIIGTVSSLFTVRSGMELAVETALGAAMQNIVTEDERASKEAIDYLKRNRVGRATFIPLDTVTPSGFNYRERLKDDGVIGLASDLVTCDEKYRKVAQFLLGRIIVTEDLDYASAVARKAGYRVRIVTADGQQINSGGTYTGGYNARQSGSFSRKAEIDRNEKQIKDILASVEKDRKSKASLDSEIETLSADLTAVESEYAVIKEDIIRAEAERQRLQNELKAIEENNAQADAELERIAGLKSARKNDRAAAEGRMKVLEAEEKRLEDSLAADDTADGFIRRRAELMDAITARRINLTELQKDAERIDSFTEELRSRGSIALARADGISSEMDRIRRENKSRQVSIASIEEQIASQKEGIEDLRRRITESTAKRADNEKQTVEIRAQRDQVTTEREKIAGEMARLDERKVSLENDYSTSVTKLWDEYELTPAEAAPYIVEFTGITELRSMVQSVRAKIRALGNVNVEAIDEYEQVKTRYDFLSAQIGDAEASRKQLLDLIDTLETEMKRIFTASFNDINTRFKRTFSELFGGGKAELFLTDENDILGSGIELDVQPPGKVIKNLSALSGGEKALVAIAIYMAILEVNPAPFCILDEIDSALDESNVARFATYLKRMVPETQMIAITHRRGTMEAADVLYGVTMQEEGVSMILRLDIEEAQVLIEGEKKKS